MRAASLIPPVGAHPARSLASRGAVKRTFGSITVFLALTLLSLGAYLIQDEFANPLDAQSIGLVIAAVTLATGAILLGYLIQPLKNKWHDGVGQPAVPLGTDRIAWAARRASAPCSEHRRDLPYQRCYVDPARIRSRR